jgi:hypothetical protein
MIEDSCLVKIITKICLYLFTSRTHCNFLLRQEKDLQEGLLSVTEEYSTSVCSVFVISGEYYSRVVEASNY